MGKKLDATVMNQQLVKLATGTTLAYCSSQPANYAGIAAMTLMAQTGLTCPAPNGGVNGTSGSFTFAAGTTANANGEVGRKATIAAATGIAAAATGVATHVALHDGTTMLAVQHVGAVTQTGTAQAGAASTITLAAGATATDDIYNGYGVRITSGPGAGQDRIISDYVGSTKVATVSSAWTVQPTSASVYEVFGMAMTSGASYNPGAVVYELNQPA